MESGPSNIGPAETFGPARRGFLLLLVAALATAAVGRLARRPARPVGAPAGVGAASSASREARFWRRLT